MPCLKISAPPHSNMQFGCVAVMVTCCEKQGASVK